MSELQNQIQEALAVAAIVDRAAETQKYGSFSARNPTLGKMRTCPYCGRRRRENSALPCCHAKILAGVRSPRRPKGRMVPRAPKGFDWRKNSMDEQAKAESRVRFKRLQHRLARKINFGLARPGSRVQ